MTTIESEMDKPQPLEDSKTATLAPEFAAIESPQERLQYALQRMREMVGGGGKPDFRAFWEVRQLCIGFFREGIHPAIRPQLWEELRDITNEARRLRDHLCEQADFPSD